MKILALALALALSGCAALHRPDGSLDVAQILNDARWGVMAACAATWLQPADCVLVEDALTTADRLVAQNVPEVGAAVRQLLLDLERPLPPTSRIRPYLDAILVLLAS